MKRDASHLSNSLKSKCDRYRVRISTAVRESNLELLESGCKLENDGTIAAGLSPYEISSIISTLIGSGKAGMLQRLMENRVFRLALQDQHIIQALTDCLPDIVYCLLEAPFNDDEEPWFKHQNQPDTRSSLLLSCSSNNTCLVVKKSKVSLDFLHQCGQRPKVAEMASTMLMNYSPDWSPSDQLIFKLFVLYYPQRYVTLMYRAHETKMREMITRMPVFYQLERLCNFIRDQDIEGIRSHFKQVIDKLVLPDIQVLSAVHLCLLYQFTEGLLELPGKDRIVQHQFHLVTRFTPILELALERQQIDWTINYLVENFNQLEGCLINRVESHYDDLLLTGNLKSLLASVPLWPFKTPFFTTQWSYRKCVYNLALKAMAGDWRYLLVFMEMNPNSILITQSAWSLLLDPLHSDKFFQFIKHVFFSMQQRVNI